MAKGNGQEDLLRQMRAEVDAARQKAHPPMFGAPRELPSLEDQLPQGALIVAPRPASEPPYAPAQPYTSGGRVTPAQQAQNAGQYAGKQ